MQNVSDKQIITCLLSRDEKVLELIEEKYGGYIFRISFNMLGDKGEAEECRNDVLLALWNARIDDENGSFAALVASVTRRISINRYNEKRRLKRVPSELTDCLDELIGGANEPYFPQDVYSSSELAGVINSFLRGLDKTDRYLFISRYYESEPIASIAKELKKSDSAIYKALKRLKKQLAAHLERNGYKL